MCFSFITYKNRCIFILLFIQVEITADNALNITEQVQNCTNMPDKLNSFDVSMTADILEKVVKANGTNREVRYFNG